MENTQINKTLLTAVIALSAIVLVGLGVGIGLLAGKGDKQDKQEIEVTQEEIAQEEIVDDAIEVKEEPKVEEKTYGHYPSFYVKKNSYWVNYEDAMHTVRIYTDSKTEVVDSYTNTRWLEEEKIGKGGSEFHVKENNEKESRKGVLTIKDNKGRTINIYVTQGGQK